MPRLLMWSLRRLVIAIVIRSATGYKFFSKAGQAAKTAHDDKISLPNDWWDYFFATRPRPAANISELLLLIPHGKHEFSIVASNGISQ
ncbi:hypothetical protein JZM24_11735 [Candidatus Sodalis endolongispinus]|uniref:Uncharacterized protein n=1 Tax=Candidatus Sodalis endolongispinus TaxID=2812662 RepID=A0ABS5YCD0_9GAMM|nr:hypothetical protein [Candidatus Sodalis endolongispinus]MBT9432627.1 hypothetical protein [Candidatus Sodalis endolongispinus]